jgi:hypothetical protein
MTSTTNARPLGDVPDAFIALLQAQTKLAEQLFANLTGGKLPTADSLVTAWQTAASTWQSAWSQLPNAASTANAANAAANAFPMLTAAKPACVVPPPCWMPRSLGECVSYVTNCNTATLRVVVTNCDRVARTIGVRIDGAEGVTVSPEPTTINPMNRATFEVSMRIPENTDSGKQFESLVWVDGCNQHYLRWTVVTGPAAFDSCYQIAVNDCPDYRHHWYDHFYCARPCLTQRGTANG